MLKSLTAACYHRLLQNVPLCLVTQPKCPFTAQDASAALRPFYFIVHPDLFGQHPSERAVNENSLKLLNEYLANQASFGRNENKEVTFFVRSQSGHVQAMKQVKICLTTHNLQETVMTVLAACGLSSSHVPLTPAKMSLGPDRPIEWHPTYYSATGKTNPNAKQAAKPMALTLRTWLKLNIEKSRKNALSVHHIEKDVARLLQKLQTDLSVEAIRFDGVWGLQHFRGCLKSFDRLCKDHLDFLQFVLRGRTLVFSNSTGVSRLGEIVLSSEDVPQTWVSMLQSVKAYDTVLARLPKMESKLSSLLNNISVVRHERQHCHVMAGEYELLLNKLLNSLRQCQDHVTRTFRNKDLSDLQLVVEGESSPLMLSSHGQFLIPASIPGTLVVDFVHENLVKALAVLNEISGFLYNEEKSKQKAVDVLGLLQLEKDESVTPEQMISCCDRMVGEDWRLSVSLTSSRLRISHYYSVMEDGQICVPWNWVGEDS